MLKTEFIPSPNPESKRLLIALHGLGDSIEGYRWMPHELAQPNLNYLLVNAPDPYYGGYSWYDFDGDTRTGVVRSRSLLTRLLDIQISEKGYRPDQILLFGFSQGCLMVLDAGLRYSHALAGIIGVSGYVFEPEELVREWGVSAKSTPILLTHGVFDPLIPIDPVRNQVRFLVQNGANVQWEEFQKEHTIAGRKELDRIRAFIVQCLPDQGR